ncbi:hypothetical protein HDU67_007818 [Dinochytrium kinnereticum]|nr:hypothetical protein HDU67_007818 [Dinochytrium kinnereticum]
MATTGCMGSERKAAGRVRGRRVGKGGAALCGNSCSAQESNLPLPPEIWARILFLASSSLKDLSTFSSVNRLSRSASWDPPSCKAALICKLFGTTQALLHIDQFGFLPDAPNILSCLLKTKLTGSESGQDLALQPQGHVDRNCALHPPHSCPVFWSLFVSNTLPDPVPDHRIPSRGGRRRRQPLDFHPKPSQRPPLSSSQRFSLAILLIQEGGLDPSLHGVSLLLPAARAESPDVLKFLTSVSVFPLDSMGRALAQAMQYGRKDQIAILVGAGALTASWAAETGPDCLLQAISNGDVGTCAVLLDGGVEPSALGLERACGSGKVDIVRELLRAGARVTPAGIHAAIKWRHVEILKALAERKPAGVFPEWESLNHAVGLHDEALVRLVLSMGVTRRPGKHETALAEWDALSIAAWDGSETLVRILLEAGLPVSEAAEEKVVEALKNDIEQRIKAERIEVTL